MTNPNYEKRKEFEENGTRGHYDVTLCYHPNDDCRCREKMRGKCSALHNTMFISSDYKTYDCPFYKTQRQFDDEEIKARARWLKKVKK